MSTPRGGRARILVADDEPHIGRIIKMKLENGPFDVTLAYDGREAIDVMRAADPPFDLFVLDLFMPECTGIDVLTALRAERGPGVPAIVLTAAGQDEQEAAALAAGATEFVTKPFSPRRLYAMVARLTGVEGGQAA